MTACAPPCMTDRWKAGRYELAQSYFEIVALIVWRVQVPPVQVDSGPFQNIIILIQNSSFLIQNSSVSMQNCILYRPVTLKLIDY